MNKSFKRLVYRIFYLVERPFWSQAIGIEHGYTSIIKFSLKTNRWQGKNKAPRDLLALKSHSTTLYTFFNSNSPFSFHHIYLRSLLFNLEFHSFSTFFGSWSLKCLFLNSIKILEPIPSSVEYAKLSLSYHQNSLWVSSTSLLIVPS